MHDDGRLQLLLPGTLRVLLQDGMSALCRCCVVVCALLEGLVVAASRGSVCMPGSMLLSTCDSSCDMLHFWVLFLARLSGAQVGLLTFRCAFFMLKRLPSFRMCASTTH